MDQAHRLRELAAALEDTGRRARVLAVTSGKGGVGKTNLSVGLALAAADFGRDVVVVDGDLGLANVDVLLDVHSRFNLSHLFSGEASLSEVLTYAPGGIRVLPGAAGVSRMANLEVGDLQRLLSELEEVERNAELLIVDTGAGISRQVTQLCLASDETLVVTTTEPPAIADAYATIKILGQADPAIRLRLVVNRAPNRTEAEQISQRLVMLSRRFLNLDVRPLGFVPNDTHVSRAVMERVPFGIKFPGAAASISVRELARRLGLEGETRESGHGFFRRVTGLFREHLRPPLRGGSE